MVSVTIKVRRAAALGPKGPTGTPGHGGQREGETMEGGEEEGGEGSVGGMGDPTGENSGSEKHIPLEIVWSGWRLNPRNLKY